MEIPALTPDKGRLVVIDAIGGDDASKEPIESLLRLGLANRGLLACDLDALVQKEKVRFLLPGDQPFFEKYDAIFVSEPTYIGIGIAIRMEIAKNGGYDARATAWAHALDRQVLYQRTILPFLRARPKRVVIQMRGLISSIVSQMLQSEDEGHPLTVKDLIGLPGNRLELSRRPDLIILIAPTPETRLSERYRSAEVMEAFREMGSEIIFIDASRKESEIAADCLQALNTLLVPA